MQELEKRILDYLVKVESDRPLLSEQQEFVKQAFREFVKAQAPKTR